MQHIAATAERGKFDMFFLGDGFATGYGEHPSTIGKFEPLTLLAALAMDDPTLGLAATGSTTYAEPYHVARAFASLDHISRRAGRLERGDHRLCQVGRRVRPPASAACRALCHGRGVRRSLPAAVG